MALAHCSPSYHKENDMVIPCEADLTCLKGVFDACDVNRDGFLTLEELCEWMKKLDLQLTRDGLQEIVRSCDRNLDGRLDFDEFVALSGSIRIPSPTNPDRIGANPSSDGHDNHQGAAAEEDSETEDLQEAFRVFDKDRNGLISPSELRSTLSQLGLLAASTSFSRIHSMIRRVDSDGDGEVNFSEFQDMMKGYNAV